MRQPNGLGTPSSFPSLTILRPSSSGVLLRLSGASRDLMPRSTNSNLQPRLPAMRSGEASTSPCWLARASIAMKVVSGSNWPYKEPSKMLRYSFVYTLGAHFLLSDSDTLFTACRPVKCLSCRSSSSRHRARSSAYTAPSCRPTSSPTRTCRLPRMLRCKKARWPGRSRCVSFDPQARVDFVERHANPPCLCERDEAFGDLWCWWMPALVVRDCRLSELQLHSESLLAHADL